MTVLHILTDSDKGKRARQLIETTLKQNAIWYTITTQEDGQ